MPTHIQWEGIQIAISHSPLQFGGPFDHIEVKADVPLPITETGYRSRFIHPQELALFESPTDFVLQWLDELATKEWLEANKQLTLF